MSVLPVPVFRVDIDASSDSPMLNSIPQRPQIHRQSLSSADILKLVYISGSQVNAVKRPSLRLKPARISIGQRSLRSRNSIGLVRTRITVPSMAVRIGIRNKSYPSPNPVSKSFTPLPPLLFLSFLFLLTYLTSFFPYIPMIWIWKRVGRCFRENLFAGILRVLQ